MKTYDNSNDNFTAVVRVLGTVIVLLLLANFYLVHQVGEARKNITVRIPPDLSLGAEVKANSISKTAVHDFAARIFQTLHRWKYSGATEYQANINSLSDFFTPAYKAFLLRDFDRRLRAGELSNRERSMQPILKAWSYEVVKVLKSSGGRATDWVVALDMELVETYRGETVKTMHLRYPMQVVRREVDSNGNPWGLALAGYAADPKEITKEMDE